MSTKVRANAANTEENRLRILDAAAYCFMASGYEATTIDSIAKRIGSTKGRIYYSYPSKAALLIGVMQEGMQRAEDAVRSAAIGHAEPLARLEAMVGAHALLVMQALSYHVVTMDGLERWRRRAMTASQRSAVTAILRQRDRYEEMFTQVIAEGVAQQVFRTLDPALTTRALLGALNSTALWYRPRHGQSTTDLATLANNIISITLHGIVA